MAYFHLLFTHTVDELDRNEFFAFMGTELDPGFS